MCFQLEELIEIAKKALTCSLVVEYNALSAVIRRIIPNWISIRFLNNFEKSTSLFYLFLDRDVVHRFLKCALTQLV